MEQPDTELPISPPAAAPEAEAQKPGAKRFEQSAENPPASHPDDYLSALADLRLAKTGSASEKSLGDATGDFINEQVKKVNLYKTTMA